MRLLLRYVPIRGAHMPRVEVLTEVAGREAETLLTEHVPSGMLANEHYADQLVERMAGRLETQSDESRRRPLTPAAPSLR